MSDEHTMIVYRGEGGLLHLPRQNGETFCGEPLDQLERREHPMTHAGLWCIGCMRGATGK